VTSPSDPITLRHGRTLPNRLALAPMTNRQSHPDGTLSDLEIAWLDARARGGFGLTMTAAAFVSPAGKAWNGQLGVSSDAHVPGLARFADRVRAAGGASTVQLHHAGLRADAAGPALPVLGSGEGWVILGVDDGFDALLEQRGFEAEASSDQPFG